MPSTLGCTQCWTSIARERYPIPLPSYRAAPSLHKHTHTKPLLEREGKLSGVSFWESTRAAGDRDGKSRCHHQHWGGVGYTVCLSETCWVCKPGVNQVSGVMQNVLFLVCCPWLAQKEKHQHISHSLTIKPGNLALPSYCYVQMQQISQEPILTLMIHSFLQGINLLVHGEHVHTLLR